MNARRGYMPDDDRNFSPEAIRTMHIACRHICYLINEGYDLKAASTFVGNHFLLTERQRLALVRSVATKEQIEQRNAKYRDTKNLNGQTVWIDGFNEVITLEVMFSHSILFRCMDGAIRDLAALRGTYRIIPETELAIRMMLDVLQDTGITGAGILLDEPVSNSGRLKAKLADIGKEHPVEMDIRIIRDVDRALYGKDNVITSDSVILDHCNSWFNLTEECVRRTHAEVIDLAEGIMK